MRLTLVLSLLCFAGAASLPAQVPVMSKVLPDSGKIGSVLKIQGVYLGKTKVDEVYLTDHTFDMKVKVLDQTEDFIEFRIPPFVKPGRLQLRPGPRGRTRAHARFAQESPPARRLRKSGVRMHNQSTVRNLS